MTARANDGGRVVRGEAATTLICPVCRRPPEGWPVDVETATCENPRCATEFSRLHPRIPIVVAGHHNILEYDVLGDLEPLSTIPERVRALELGGRAWEWLFRVSMYLVAYYGERPNLVTELCDLLLDAVDTGDEPIESAVDLGCGVGALAIEVAHRTGAAVVGLDSDPLALRWAERAGSGGPLEAPVRRSARRFEMRALTPGVEPSPGTVAWVCATVAQPPLSAESFDLVLAVNLLDTVTDPWMALGQASALLRPGGYLLMAQPDAWTADTTPPGAWLAAEPDAWEPVLARFGLETVASRDGLEWTLRGTDRVSFTYRLHARVARRGDWPADPGPG